jgi:hypothetical protein
VPGGYVTIGLSSGGTVTDTKRWAERLVLEARERWEQAESDNEVAAESAAQEVSA